MASGKRKTPDLFKDAALDPVEIATGHPQRPPKAETSPSSAAAKSSLAPKIVAKKKAGFYLSVELLNRFTHKFYELKLAGVPIENKSNLLEAMLAFALDDIDRGDDSQVIKKITDTFCETTLNDD